MEEYFITHIIDIDCDEEGYIIVKFEIEGDDAGYFRKIESENYFVWAEEIYGGDEITFENIGDDWDEEYNTPGFFNFTKWMEYEHGEETVKDFINYTYETIEELPKPTY